MAEGGLGRRRGPWRTAVVCAAVAALMAGHAGAAPASAHAALERSVPGDGERLATAPRQVDLYFGQQLVQNRSGTFAVVLGEAGTAVSDESRLDPQDGRHLIAPLRGSLDAGRYTVFWKTTSDEDGGVTLGSFSFTVRQPATPQPEPGGQVLVPDDLRSRAFTAVVRQGGGNGGLAIGLGIGGTAGLALGAGGAYVLSRRGQTRAATPAARPARGRRR